MSRSNRLRIVTILIVVGLLVSSVSSVLARSPGSSVPAAESATAPPQTNPASAPARAQMQEGGDSVQIALAYIESQAKEWGMSPEDIAALEVSDVYTSKNNGVTHVYFIQRLNDLDIFNAITVVNVNADGSILSAGNRFVSDAASRVQPALDAGEKSDGVSAQSTDGAIISADEAYRSAAEQLGLPADKPVIVTQEKGGVAAAQAASEGAAVPARLVYQLTEKGLLLLAWDLQIDDSANANFWSVRVDANSGEVLAVDNWVIHDNWGVPEHNGDRAPSLTESKAVESPRQVPAPAPHTVPPAPSYLVYPMPVESPIHTAPVPPADGRSVVNDPADATASPFGWHDTDGVAGAEFTITRGNNVNAYTDRDNDNAADAGSQPDGTASLSFSPPITLTEEPLAYRHAAVVNLFYWNNIIHDVFHRYGFDEAAGNFQVNNYGNGGIGGDDVRAEAQDAANLGTRNNANFFTPVDGSQPRMQMYLWNTASPELDGDLDSGIIVHEYGHGISIRLTGGPSTTSCLNNNEQAGEGWSDWFGLMLTMDASDVATDGRGIGTYALNQPTTGPGIRPARYSTDMGVNNYTYGNLPSMAVPHGVGFVFATMLWEMTWGLVDEHGFDPDFYTGAGGNNIALQLVTDGLKLQPCGPGFVDSRNAILAADMANNGGANQCIIWKAFAKRGLGFSASQGSAGSSSDGAEAFDLPQSCLFLNAQPPSQAICVGSVPTYTITANVAYTEPVTLGVSGHPAGTSATFGANPLNGPLPQSTELSIGSTGGAAAGDYTITITGTDSTLPTPIVESVDVSLTVYADIPGQPTLTSPANGAIDVNPSPTLVWSGVAQASGYVVEVDDDPGFGSIDYSAPVAGASHTLPVSLAPATTHYWRVKANNLCGDGAVSSTFSFTTLNLYCSTPNAAIPDNSPTGVFDIFSPAAAGGLDDLDVLLDVSHTWVGDLAMTLEHVPSGVTAVVVDRPGRVASGVGCSGNDMNIFLDDEAGLSVETNCQNDPNPAYIDGAAYQPNNPLSAFDGLDLAGPWKFSVSDNAGADTGTLQQWCLAPKLRFVSAAPATQDICIGDTVQFDLLLNNFTTLPVALSSSGQPAGSTVLFTPNPAVTIPSTATMSVGNTAGSPLGPHTIVITGSDGIDTKSASVTLNLLPLTLTPATLITPANSASGVGFAPLFVWSASPGASEYLLEVASDAGFASVVYSETLATTSHQMNGMLTPGTPYHWRVTARNLCAQAVSAVSNFTTRNLVCSVPGAAIPDDDPAGISDMINLASGGPLLDLDIYLRIDHTWVGDLKATLEHVGSGAPIALVDRPGVPASSFGCGSNNIHIFLDDGATLAVETACIGLSSSSPAYAEDGVYRPNDLLSVFNGQNAAGDWKLVVSDNLGADTGVVQEWCIAPDVAPNEVTITIVKDAAPDSATNFRFTGSYLGGSSGSDSGSSIGDFYLDDAVPNDGDAYGSSKSFTVPRGAVYSFSEPAVSGWYLSAITCTPAGSATVNLATRSVMIDTSSGSNVTCTFKNEKAAALTVRKYREMNGTSGQQAPEPFLSTWTIQAKTSPTGTLVAQAATNALGKVSFSLKPGPYKVCEVQKSGWTQKVPNPAVNNGCHLLTLLPGSATQVDFGNCPNSTCPAMAAEVGQTDAPVAPLVFAVAADDLDGWLEQWLLTPDGPVEETLEPDAGEEGDATQRVFLPVVVK